MGLFSLALLLAGLALLRLSGRWGLLGLSLGAASHLVLDLMWDDPQTLLWPLLSWRFPSYESVPNLADLAELPFTELYTGIGELVEGSILIAFLVRLRRAQRASVRFAKSTIESMHRVAHVHIAASPPVQDPDQALP